jgi:hypothetical protein
MVDAKSRFIGPSTASISTPSVSSSVPSPQAGPSSWGEPFGPAERSESELRRPPALTSGASPRNDVLQGLPERPLMDSRRLPDAEVVILRDKRGDSQDVPSSKKLSGDVFSAPSDAGLTYASSRVTQRPNPASSSASNFEIQRDFASGREDASGRGELPAAVSIDFNTPEDCSHWCKSWSGANSGQPVTAGSWNSRDSSVIADFTFRHRFPAIDGQRSDCQRGP